MSLKNKLIKLNQHYLALYSYAKFSVIILILLSFLSSIIETIGFVSLLPLLTITLNEGGDNFLVNLFKIFFQNFNITFNTVNLMIFIVFLFIFKAILVFFQKYYSSIIVKGLRIKLRNDTISLINNINFRYFISKSKSYFINPIITETGRFVTAINNLVKLIFLIISLIIYLPTSFIIDFRFSIFFYLVCLFFSILGLYITKKTKIYSQNISSQNEKIQSEITSFINFFGYFKSTNFLKKYSKIIQDENNKLFVNEKKIEFNSIFLDTIKEPIAVILIVSIMFMQLTYFNANLSNTVVFILIIYKIILQTLTIPARIQIINSMAGGVDSINNLHKSAYKNKDKLIQNTQKIKNRLLNLESVDKISLKNVSFNYHENKILNNISTVFTNSKINAVVGKSGSGKSTLIKIILGLLSPSDGKIIFNDQEINDIDISLLRNNIGYTPQEALIFNDSLWNNVTLWSEVNENNKNKFFDLVNLIDIDFIDLTNNDIFEKNLGDFGNSISGGQKQKIALIRELFKKPKILIMDEPARSLDSKNEKKFYEILNLQNKMIIIMVTHNLLFLNENHKISLFEKGKLIFNGSLDNAMKCKEFKSLYEYQLGEKN